jgi:hypothetical protein
MTLKKFCECLFLVSMTIWIVTCAPDYRDKTTANGRQAILDAADNALTSGDCDGAINILAPLIQSAYSNNDALMRYSAAYGCKGGVNLPNLVGGLQGSSNVFSTIVKTNYSTSGDGKTAALDRASDILRQTTTPPNGWDAYQRTPDANMFMIFVQLNLLGTVIAPLGHADKTTGSKTNAISNTGSAADKCHVLIAIAYIQDSLSYVSVGSGLSSLSTISSLCSGALGASVCSTITKDYNQCLGAATEQAQGQVLINALDNAW